MSTEDGQESSNDATRTQNSIVNAIEQECVVAAPLSCSPVDLPSMRGSRKRLLSSAPSRIAFKVPLTPAFCSTKLIWLKQ